MNVNQIALSCRDRGATRIWYAQIFGYLPAGAQGPDFPQLPPEAPTVDVLQGLPGARFSMSWAVDAQEFFQLEFFEYERPATRPLPEDWRLSDIGYGLVVLHVAAFDATLERLAAAGTPPLGAPVGEPGARRVCVRDPDGVLLELLERDVRVPGAAPRPRPEVGVAARGVRASVADLDRSTAFFADVLGMRPADDDALLHGPEHEALWGLEGAERELRLLTSGDFWVELAHYSDPPGRPWPDGYAISDRGILNIALGARTVQDYDATRARVLAAGVHVNPEIRIPAGAPVTACTYLMDDQGFSAELLLVTPELDADLGFAPEG